MKKYIVLLCLLVAQFVTAQVTTGPVSTSNRLTWGATNGDTAVLAQAYEVRVRIDNAATPIIVPNPVCTANRLTDSTNAVWTFGTGAPPSIALLRNNTSINAFGTRLALSSGTIYAFGDDAVWYKWSGTVFLLLTSSDPTPAVLDNLSTGRWTCQAPLPRAIVLLLNNSIGVHSVTLRLYESVSKVESVDSIPFPLTTPMVITQPIRVSIQ